MLQNFIEYFQLNGHAAAPSSEDGLDFGSAHVEVRQGIPRFSPDETYSSGNFSVLRDRHPALQMDSQQGLTDRRDLILFRTGWPEEFFAGKTILECGCGAGADTEVLLGLGARVLAADLAGVDVARRNLGDREELCLVQADITDLPLKQRSFDIVFCHRVLQHTENPAETLRHILQFVRPGGAAFVHSYSRDARQMLRWKYLLRPLTTRMNPDTLYHLIKSAAPFFFRFTNAMYRFGPLGRAFTWVFVPFLNYSYKPKYANMSRDFLIEYGVHDTFDALSAVFDRPISASKMHQIASEKLDRPFSVTTAAAVTLLRTAVE